MGKHFTLFLAVVVGNLTFLIRKWQWLTAYDGKDQVFLPGSLATYALFLSLGIAAAVFLLFSRRAQPTICVPRSCPDTWYMVCMTISGFLFFGAGFLGLFTGYYQFQMWQASPTHMLLNLPLSTLLCGILCLLSGMSVLMLGRIISHGADPASRAPILSQVPAFTGIIWMFVTHMTHATDPVLLNYGILLAAVVFLTLASYEVASYVQKIPHPTRFCFFSCMGIVLSFTVQADTMSWFFRCMVVAFLFYTVAQFYASLCSPQVTSST